MNSVVNSKRVFCVQPHRPVGFGEMLGKRGDIRLDVGTKKPRRCRAQILAAAHAYQMSSARDELAPHYHARAELLGRTPNLLIVSTNGAATTPSTSTPAPSAACWSSINPAAMPKRSPKTCSARRRV